MFEKGKKIDIKVLFSLLWVVVVINVVIADIFGMTMGVAPDINSFGVEVPEVGMLVFAMIMEIPIAMIVLSRLLKYRTNRKANIIAGIITILYVAAGATISLVYAFFTAIEIICLLAIIVKAWKWKEVEA